MLDLPLPAKFENTKEIQMGGALYNRDISGWCTGTWVDLSSLGILCHELWAILYQTTSKMVLSNFEVEAPLCYCNSIWSKKIMYSYVICVLCWVKHELHLQLEIQSGASTQILVMVSEIWNILAHYQHDTLAWPVLKPLYVSSIYLKC